MALPPLPAHQVEVVDEEPVGPSEVGFLTLRRRRMCVKFANGSRSDPFLYDAVDRARLDAVVVVAHAGGPSERRVLLRSALRPPVALRPLDVRPTPEKPTLGALWEVIAGLVERDERSPEGLQQCAARELLEEGGYEVAAHQLSPLGPSTFPAPGVIGERHFFFHVAVDPTSQTVPTEDGSALEQGASLHWLLLAEALELCRRGEIEDAKTELALRRLEEIH